MPVHFGSDGHEGRGAGGTDDGLNVKGAALRPSLVGRRCRGGGGSSGGIGRHRHVKRRKMTALTSDEQTSPPSYRPVLEAYYVRT